METVFAGTITWLDKENEVAYIRRKSGADVYAQLKDVNATVVSSLTVGQEVEFTIQASENGLIARDIAPC